MQAEANNTGNPGYYIGESNKMAGKNFGYLPRPEQSRFTNPEAEDLYKATCLYGDEYLVLKWEWLRWVQGKSNKPRLRTFEESASGLRRMEKDGNIVMIAPQNIAMVTEMGNS